MLADPPILETDRVSLRFGGVRALTDFWQTAPQEGAPASEPTEVRILYSDDTLYFGVGCHDSDPAGIVVSDARRDALPL